MLTCQLSSIGKLGPETGWLTQDFLPALSAGSPAPTPSPTPSRLNAPPRLRLVYPCVADVRDSLEGYAAGGALPNNARCVGGAG